MLTPAQNLERNRQKKRAIGTLAVAIKKRFFALSGEDEAPGGVVEGGQKPTNINRKYLHTTTCPAPHPYHLPRHPHPGLQDADEERDLEGHRDSAGQPDAREEQV